MGNNLTKTVQNDFLKFCNKHKRRRVIKIDKSTIGDPIEFKHTCHVGNSESAIDQENALDEVEFMAMMSQITESLQKLPLQARQHSDHNNKFYSRKVVPNDGIYNKASEITHNRMPAIALRKRNTINKLKTDALPSSSMSISPDNHITNSLQKEKASAFSEKELPILQQTKTSHTQQSLKNEEEESLNVEQKRKAFIASSLIDQELKNGYNDFSTCLQNRIEAQVKKVARFRSTRRSSSTNNNRPALMI
ncbi:MAG: hypothetical protein EXX96DRAFT_621667 [Benjaminiella poitrasii]|nr:MAG: hypothetical protein EXX96DRAFT_621667 [Benjaminiella poitrasii]